MHHLCTGQTVKLCLGQTVSWSQSLGVNSFFFWVFFGAFWTNSHWIQFFRVFPVCGIGMFFFKCFRRELCSYAISFWLSQGVLFEQNCILTNLIEKWRHLPRKNIKNRTALECVGRMHQNKEIVNGNSWSNPLPGRLSCFCIYVMWFVMVRHHLVSGGFAFGKASSFAAGPWVCFCTPGPAVSRHETDETRATWLHMAPWLAAGMRGERWSSGNGLGLWSRNDAVSAVPDIDIARLHQAEEVLGITQQLGNRLGCFQTFVPFWLELRIGVAMDMDGSSALCTLQSTWGSMGSMGQHGGCFNLACQHFCYVIELLALCSMTACSWIFSQHDLWVPLKPLNTDVG